MFLQNQIGTTAIAHVSQLPCCCCSNYLDKSFETTTEVWIPAETFNLSLIGCILPSTSFLAMGSSNICCSCMSQSQASPYLIVHFSIHIKPAKTRPVAHLLPVSGSSQYLCRIEFPDPSWTCTSLTRMKLALHNMFDGKCRAFLRVLRAWELLFEVGLFFSG